MSTSRHGSYAFKYELSRSPRSVRGTDGTSAFEACSEKKVAHRRAAWDLGLSWRLLRKVPWALPASYRNAWPSDCLQMSEFFTSGMNTGPLRCPAIFYHCCIVHHPSSPMKFVQSSRLKSQLIINQLTLTIKASTKRYARIGVKGFASVSA